MALERVKHLWFFFLASNPLSRRFGVCHLVIDSDFVIMAGADVPQARDYRSPGAQQLVAAQKAKRGAACAAPRRLKLAT